MGCCLMQPEEAQHATRIRGLRPTVFKSKVRHLSCKARYLYYLNRQYACQECYRFSAFGRWIRRSFVVIFKIHYHSCFWQKTCYEYTWDEIMLRFSVIRSRTNCKVHELRRHKMMHCLSDVSNATHLFLALNIISIMNYGALYYLKMRKLFVPYF